jgi:hypothetical protein
VPSKAAGGSDARASDDEDVIDAFFDLADAIITVRTLVRAVSWGV